MPLVTMRQILDHAAENNYGVPAFNINDMEQDEDLIVITCKPTDFSKVKDVVEKIIPNVEYEIDEIGMYPKEKITLDGEDLETFNKLYHMIDEIDDVSEIYTNVEMN